MSEPPRFTGNVFHRLSSSMCRPGYAHYASVAAGRAAQRVRLGLTEHRINAESNQSYIGRVARYSKEVVGASCERAKHYPDRRGVPS